MLAQLLHIFCVAAATTDQLVDKAKDKTGLIIYRFPKPNLIRIHND